MRTFAFVLLVALEIGLVRWIWKQVKLADEREDAADLSRERLRQELRMHSADRSREAEGLDDTWDRAS